MFGDPLQGFSHTCLQQNRYRLDVPAKQQHNSNSMNAVQQGLTSTMGRIC